MQEEKEQKPSDSISADATSRKTLSDVEESEKVSDVPAANETSAPLSPDGAMDSDLSERNPKVDVDPN